MQGLLHENDVMVDDFIWDKAKNESNIQKHGVSFMEARTIFYDQNYLCIADEDHSQHEERFIALGVSENKRLLVVCHCERENNLTRIISARKAGKQEEVLYVRG